MPKLPVRTTELRGEVRPRQDSPGIESRALAWEPVMTNLAGTASGGLQALERAVTECVGETRAGRRGQNRAYERPLGVLEHPAAAPEVQRIALVGFATQMLAELAVEFADGLPELRQLIRRVETVLGIPAFELGRELMRAPQLFRLPAAAAIEVQLALLRAFTESDVVSLWRTSPGRKLERIACAGRLNGQGRRTRQLARRLLDGKLAVPTPAVDVTAILIDCADGAAALIASGNSALSAEHALLVEAAIPVLIAALGSENRLARWSRPEHAVDRAIDRTSAAERRLTRVRFDLHDGPQQDLVLLAEDLRLFRCQLDSVLGKNANRERLVGRIDDLEARLVALDGDLRRISVSTESPFLQTETLQSALDKVISAFSERTAIEPEARFDGDFTGLTDSQHITLLGLIRESLSNIREHSHAKHVSIVVSAGPQGVTATVTDDGRGFDPETTLVRTARQGHLGLVGMHERVRLLGGHTQIDSRPGGPTVISATLPPAPVSAQRRRL
jgi:signal transduction histidine kinase